MSSDKAASTDQKARATASEDPIRKAIGELDYLIDRANDLLHSRSQLEVSEALRNVDEAKELRNATFDLLFALGDFDPLVKEIQGLKVVVKGRAWEIDPDDTTPAPAGIKLSKKGNPSKSKTKSVPALIPNTFAIDRLEKLMGIAKQRLSAKLPAFNGTAVTRPLSRRDLKLCNQIESRYGTELKTVFEHQTDTEIKSAIWYGVKDHFKTADAIRSALKRIRKFHMFPLNRQVREKRSK